MSKFLELKEKVEAKGTDKMKQTVRLTEKHYIDGLDSLFKERPVSKAALNTYFLLWRKDIESDEEIQAMSDLEGKILFLDIFYILRHTWELEQEGGEIKTGNDLHEAYPELFEGEDMFDVEEVFNRLTLSW